MGTPSYMSPEQVKGRAVDGRSDIFSLGVMLYEMVTGEKPFPGQNITTVIYKIVNEDPVPPRQIDPSIHPGISAAVMKALEKEPEQRYQSCREMLEDLRNYRSVAPGGNPQSTMVMGGGSPAATLISGNAGGRGMGGDDRTVAVAAQSLNSRASGPGQTPVVRRTGAIAPVQEPPKKKSVVGTILAALLLLGVIVYGAIKIRPVFEAAKELHDAQKKSGSVPAPAPAPAPTTSEATPDNSAATPAVTETLPQPKDSTTTPAASAETKPAEVIPEKVTPKKTEPSVSAKAAEYKGHIDKVISDRGLNGHVRVQASGNTLTVAGKLRPAEHGALLGFLRNAPSNVRVIDHIEYDDTPVAAVGNPDEGGHPVPETGRGAIHVVTDVIGANAVLRGQAGHVLSKCDTPCSFNNLSPAQYSLEVQKEGYQSVQTALQVKRGDVQDQKIKLESLAKGIYVTSKPPGADVFINGAKQSGQTPVTLPLAPGQYNLVLRLPGYEAYAGSIQVKDNIQTQLDATLNEKSATRVAWAQVNTDPKGAEILVDGTSTGQVTPARVQVPAGLHNITLRLNGYQQAKRTVQVSEGGTVTIDEALRPKQ